MKMKKLAISITAIVGGNLFAFAPIAMAQEAANTESNAQNGKEESVEVIMVSASRRIERLQDVPIAVSALTGDQLEASTFKDVKDIAYTFSGVQYGESPNDQGFRVRGVGVMGGYSSASEAPVGVVQWKASEISFESKC
jgi:iron complex outermembrane recepter protein